MPEAIIHSSLLAQIAGLSHGFTTRLTSAQQNAELESIVTTGKQIHTDQFFWPEAYERRTHEADGVGTLRPDFAVGVYSADCTPVLLALTQNEKVYSVMAVHAGWRGTALGIVAKSVKELVEKSGCNRTSLKLYAAIGPCISFKNFEVGEDVIQAFPDCLAQGLALPSRMDGTRQKYQFNLPGENLKQLQIAAGQMGVEAEVDNLALCTVADPTTFPSFRRDRQIAGRILSYIAFRTDRAEVP